MSDCVKEFHKDFNKAYGVNVGDNCVFEVSFFNESKGVRTSTIMSGRKLLDTCLKLAESTYSFLEDGVNMAIEILSIGDAKESSLIELFEAGIKLANNPDKYATEDNLKLIRPFM